MDLQKRHELETKEFSNAYNACKFASFCAYNNIKCKLGRDGGVWWVSY